ncbi:MAG: hypothetical protein ACK4I8_05385 [Armatimonadota bacterium]
MAHKALRFFKTLVTPFWTKRRVKGMVIAYLALMPFSVYLALGPFKVGMTESHETFLQTLLSSLQTLLSLLRVALIEPVEALPVIATPALAALALFDWRQGKRTDLRNLPPERIALTLALGCLLPLIALRLAACLLGTVMIFLDSFVSTFRFLVWEVFEEPVLLEQARRAGATTIQIVSPSFHSPFSASLYAFSDWGEVVAEIPAWFALWGLCFIIAATERKVDGAMVRAYLYGVVLALVPWTIVQGIHAWLSGLERNLSPTATFPSVSSSRVSSWFSLWFSLLVGDIYRALWNYLETSAAFIIWAGTCLLLWVFFQKSRWWRQRLATD